MTKAFFLDRNPDADFIDAILKPGAIKGRGPFKMFCAPGSTGLTSLGIHEWSKNHWKKMDKAAGKLLVQKWMLNDPDFRIKFSDTRTANIWEGLNTALFDLDTNPAIINNEDDITPDGYQLKDQPIAIPFERHYLVFSGGKIRIEKPDPKYLIRYEIKFDLTPYVLQHENEYKIKPVNPDSIFGKYIQQTFPDPAVRAVVQEFFSAPFFQSTSFQKALWIFGDGSNGKSTLQKILRKIMPTFQATSFESLSTPHAAAYLTGATVIGIAEVGEGKIPEALFKSLISPCVRLVVASKIYLNFGGSNGITIFGSIYRAGVNQGIFTWRQDGQVGRGRAERQLSYG